MWADRGWVSFGKAPFALIDDIGTHDSAATLLLFNGVLIGGIRDRVFIFGPKLCHWRLQVEFRLNVQPCEQAVAQRFAGRIIDDGDSNTGRCQ